MMTIPKVLIKNLLNQQEFSYLESTSDYEKSIGDEFSSDSFLQTPLL